MKVARELNVKRITYALFQQAKSSNTKLGTVVAITSPLEGEGVTHVSRILCHELAGDQYGRTLYCTVDSLANAPLEADTESSCLMTDDRFWMLASANAAAKSAWEFKPAVRQARIDVLRRRFDYVIIDCPAVGKSSDVAAVASLVDAVLLVVAAGCSSKHHINFAQKVIAECGGMLRGCILNRRTYPVPSLVYNLLKGGSH